MSGDAEEARRRPNPEPLWSATLLSADPLIIASTVSLRPIPLFDLMPQALSERPCTFLMGMGWTADNADVAWGFASVAKTYLSAHPRHRVVLLCNEAGACDRLRAAGVEARLIYQNAFIDERLFRPLRGQPQRFDAVYNAQFALWKRHHLASGIERLALIGYDPPDEPSTVADYVASLRRCMPRATFINDRTRGTATWLWPDQVNDVLNQSLVGLCLSTVEGGVYASVEYLLSGLPVVSTPSQGGREVFFDPEFCLLVPPEPGAVRDGVATLIERGVPRVESVRRELFTLVQSIYDDAGVRRRFADEWPSVRRHRLVEWVPVRRFWSEVERTLRRRRRWQWLPRRRR